MWSGEHVRIEDEPETNQASSPNRAVGIKIASSLLRTHRTLD
jgi:hypothetical protein